MRSAGEGVLCAALVLLLAGFAPGLWLASAGGAASRLGGMEFATVAAVLATTVLSVAWQQTMYLIVPLVLMLVSVPGTLV